MPCYIPIIPVSELDLTDTYAIDDSYIGDVFESRDGYKSTSSKKILLRTYSELTESYYYKREHAFEVSGLIGLYVCRESQIYD